jgi:hypothetical protein
MATPNWDILSLRFASAVRDSVSSASTNGDELMASDRDAYLNYAYAKYIGLLIKFNPSIINTILEELYASATVVITAGAGTLPADFGYFIHLHIDTDVIVTKPSVEDFIKLIDVSTVQNPPSTTNIYVNIKATTINILPASFAGNTTMYYIKKAPTKVQGSNTDIGLRSDHFDTLVELAKYYYYVDKQEYEIAKSILDNAILTAPYKIGEVK